VAISGGGVVDGVVDWGGVVDGMSSVVDHGGGVVDSMVDWGSVVNCVSSMVDHGGGVVDSVVGSGVMDSVSRSTEVGESGEGHVRAGSHERDESNQGKGLHDVLMC